MHTSDFEHVPSHRIWRCVARVNAQTVSCQQKREAIDSQLGVEHTVMIPMKAPIERAACC